MTGRGAGLACAGEVEVERGELTFVQPGCCREGEEASVKVQIHERKRRRRERETIGYVPERAPR